MGIEFHGNLVNRRKAKRSGQKYRNPYDMGWKRNWQQVYGDRLPIIPSILILSTREPDFLPIPTIGGEDGKRKHLRRSSKSSRSVNALNVPPFDEGSKVNDIIIDDEIREQTIPFMESSSAPV